MRKPQISSNQTIPLCDFQKQNHNNFCVKYRERKKNCWKNDCIIFAYQKALITDKTDSVTFEWQKMQIYIFLIYCTDRIQNCMKTQMTFSVEMQPGTIYIHNFVW